jgi:hypothetical protein
MDSQRADVAAGKFERADDMGVGAHHQPSGRQGIEPGGIMPLIEQGIGEMAGENLADQAGGGQPAAAMGHFNAGTGAQDRAHSAASIWAPSICAIVSARR